MSLSEFLSSSPAGINQGSCYRINHFPDDNDYDTDSSEYLLRKCPPHPPSPSPPSASVSAPVKTIYF